MDTTTVSSMAKIAYLEDNHIYPVGTSNDGDAIYKTTKEFYDTLKNYGIMMDFGHKVASPMAGYTHYK